VAGFVISRRLYARWNSFDDGEYLWQTVDFNLLRTHLAQSIFYLHSQPPLLNLFLGVVLKLTPDPSYVPDVLQACYRLMGLSLMLIMFQLMLDLGVPAGIALALTLLFEFNPGTLMLENWCYTAYPSQLLFCGSAFCLYRFLERGKHWIGLSFLICAALPIFFNSSFQPLWFICVAAFCYYGIRERFREMLPAIAVIAGLIATLVIKNAMVFGIYTTSSWLGMNLARVTMPLIWNEDIRREVLAGELSEFAFIQPFEPLDKYPMEKAPPTGIAVLDTRAKDNGTCNYNNILYIDISRHYLKDAVYSLIHHPNAYLHEMIHTCGCYFGTVKDQDSRKSIRLGEWNRLYDLILQPAPLSWWPRQQRCDWVDLTLLVGLPMIFVLASIRLARADRWNSANIATAFLLMTIAYTTVMALTLEIGENPRFRSVVDPLFLVLLACLLGDRYRRVGPRLNSGVFRTRAERMPKLI
jgi:hypothetical protein